MPRTMKAMVPRKIVDLRETAPLLCAGAIDYRSLCLAQLQPGAPLGLTGFGASAHLVVAASPTP